MNPRRWRSALLLAVVLLLVGLGGWALSRSRKLDPPATWDQVQRAMRRKDWEGAGRLLERWLEAHPRHVEALLTLARVRQTTGRQEDAVRLLGEVPEADREWPTAQAMLGELAIEDRRAADAERHLRAAAAREKTALPTRQRLLYLMSIEQRTAEARDLLWEIRGILADPMVLVDLALEALIDLHDVRNLPPELEQFVTRTPEDPFLQRAWGMALLFQGKSAEALPLLSSAAERLANDPSGRFALAECLILEGRAPAVKDVLGDLPAGPSEAAAWWVYRGRLEESLGSPQSSADSFREALAIQPDHREAHLRLGHALERFGKNNEASEHLLRAREIGAKFAAARREFRQAKRTGLPRNGPLFEKLGKHCQQTGLIREARAWYEEALSIDPSLADSRKALEELRPLPDTLPIALARPVLVPGERGNRARWAAVPGTPPGGGNVNARSQPGGKAVDRISFEDVAASSRVDYTYNCGVSERLFIGETMGGGVGLIDFDDDGWLDIYFVNGCSLPYDAARPPAPNRLYRNRRDGTFEDVTSRAGVAGQGYGMGCAVGDFDNDGHDDLFVTGLDRTILYRNKGDGTFEDFTQRAGVYSDRWTTAAGFGDLDNDGDLDLVVICYLDVKPDDRTQCRDPSGRPMHCPPARFPAQLDLMYSNNGDGTFTEMSHAAGFEAPEGRGLGLAIADLDDDGKLDIFVANDSSQDFLFRNRGDMKFEEVAASAGVATNGSGQSTASMGVVADDLDGDGRPDLFVTNLINESSTLFRNLGPWLYHDATLGAGLDAPSRGKTGFGDAAIDADNDGILDLFVANGEVDDRPWMNSPMAQRPLMFRGTGKGRFEVEGDSPRFPYLQGKRVGRGVAAGDLDNDGRVDLVVVHRDGPAAILHNRTDGGGWLAVTLRGRESGQTAVGARLICQAGGRTLVRRVTSGTGYLSAHDPRLHLGLGEAEMVEKLEVRWPSGRTQRWSNVKANRFVVIEEARDHIPAQ